jgi:methionyl-tRNA synthetase
MLDRCAPGLAMSRRTLLAIDPVVPRADLGIDRLASTVLGADIYKRYLALSGTRAHCVLLCDDHGSEVDLVARRLQLDPDRLAAEAREAIGASLRAYSIGLDRFGGHGASYIAFVRTFFSNLANAGLLELRNVNVPYDIVAGTYPSEESLRGACPNCLELTSGGACDTCGHPNAGIDLLGLDPHRYALRREPRFVLDLERFRPEIEAKLVQMSGVSPYIARLIQAVLARPLSPIIVSTRSPRGISMSFAGASDQKLHAAAESYVGQLHLFERAAGALSADDTYLQFTRFGSLYRSLFVHTGLAAAAVHCNGLAPSLGAVVASHGIEHAGAHTEVWARDLTDVYESDAVRLYLASVGPSPHEACFVRSALDAGIARVSTPIDRLIAHWNEWRAIPEWTPPRCPPRDLVHVMSAPLALDDFATPEPARRALRALDYFWHKLRQPGSSLARYVPSVLALALEPFCPEYVAALRTRFPEAATSWQHVATCARTFDLPQFEMRARGPGVATMSLVGVESPPRIPGDSHHEAIVYPEA